MMHPPHAHARIALRLVVAGACVWLSGCAADRGPYSALAESARDSGKAQELTQRAAAIIETHPGRAEKLLREALTSDLYHGPAHNNLGVIYLGQRKWYEAASEFEWARKLMPGHPDPRVNLAVVLERAGRTDDALSAYASALEVYPGHLAATQGLARLQARSGRTDHRTPKLLEEIAMRGEDEQWRSWARRQQLKSPRVSEP